MASGGQVFVILLAVCSWIYMFVCFLSYLQDIGAFNTLVASIRSRIFSTDLGSVSRSRPAAASSSSNSGASKDSSKVFLTLRIIIASASLFYIIWFILAYYVQWEVSDATDRFCNAAPRIEMALYASIRSTVLLFFLVRLRVTSYGVEGMSKWLYFLLALIVCTWVFAIIQVFEITVGTYKGWCGYAMKESAFAGYFIFVLLFALAHSIMFYKFVKLLGEHKQFSSSKSIGSSAAVVKLDGMIKRSKSNFIAYTISAFIADFLYILAYFIYTYHPGSTSDAGRETLSTFVDSAYVIDILVSAVSVIGTARAFKCNPFLKVRSGSTLQENSHSGNSVVRSPHKRSSAVLNATLSDVRARGKSNIDEVKDSKKEDDGLSAKPGVATVHETATEEL